MPFLSIRKRILQKVWGLLNVTVCLVHHIELTDYCYSCGKKISWTSGNVLWCNCGFSHKSAVPNRASNDSIELAKLIFSKLDLTDTVDSMNEKIRTLKIHELDEIMIFLGRYMNQVQNPQQFSGIKYSNIDYIDLQCRVFKILKDWPNAYYAFLDGIKETTKKSNFTKIIGDFGKFYNELARDRKGSFSLLKEEFRNYLVMNSQKYLGTNFIRVTNKYEQYYVSSQEAASYLGISRTKLIKLIEKGVIEGIV